MLCIEICGIKFVVNLVANMLKIGGADSFFFVLFCFLLYEQVIKEVLIEVIKFNIRD